MTSASVERPPVKRRVFYGWVIVAVALMMNLTASSTNPVVFSFFIAPMAEDLGWSRSTLAWSLTFRMVVAGLVAPFIGSLLDRHGARWIGMVGATLAGVCLMLYSFVQDVWMLYLLSALSGAAGFGGPGGALLTATPLARWFQEKRGRAMAIATIGMPGGTVLAIPFTEWLISAIGWRNAWVVFGLIIVGVAAPLCAIFMRRSPEEMGLRPDGLTAEEAAHPKVSARPSLVTTVDWTLSQALRTPTLWIILAALTFAGLALQGTLVHRVAFWKDTGMSSGLVALGTAMDPFTVIFAVLIFGVVAERVRLRWLGLIGGGGFALSMLPMIFPTGEAWSIMTHNVVWGAAAGAFVAVNNLVWPNFYGRRYVGAIRGFIFPISVGAAGLGAPLYGYILDAGVAPRLVWTGSLTLFAIGAVLLFIARTPRLRGAEDGGR